MFKWFNEGPDTRFLKVDTSKYKVFLNKTIKCHRCGEMVSKENDWCWVSKCKGCGTLVLFFNPTPIQQVAALSRATILFNIGAVGSGKTTISSYIFSNGIRNVPNSKMIAAAQTMDQLSRNAMPELLKFFHPSEFKKKLKDKWIMKNGSTIEFWVSDNPDKLRSANANFIWLVEANSHKMKLFYDESISRLRNQLGLVYATDDDGNILVEKTATGQEKPIELYNRNLLIVEGNPKTGAWFNDTILSAHTILYTPNVRGMKSIKARAKPLRAFDRFSGKETNADIVGILNASFDNPMLDSGYFIRMRAACQTQEEYEQKVYCDITSQDGLVFKEIIDNINRFKVNFQGQELYNNNWVFVETLDPGGSKSKNDPDAYILGLFNKEFKQLIVLDCFKTSGLLLDETVSRIWAIRNKWGWCRDRLLLFTGDNVLKRTSKTDRGSLKLEYEIRLSCGIDVCDDKAINFGINLVKSWFEKGGIKLNTMLSDPLINELYNYQVFRVPKGIKGSDSVVYDIKYTDINNHLIDALRYLIVKLEAYGFRQDQYQIDYRKYEQQQERLRAEELEIKYKSLKWNAGKFLWDKVQNENSKKNLLNFNKKFKL